MTCPEPCANTVSVVVSNDGDEQTGTQAETGLIRFVAHMIKCYIHSQIMVAAIERKISLKKKTKLSIITTIAREGKTAKIVSKNFL